MLLRSASVALWALGFASRAVADSSSIHSYRYGTPLPVECMNRSSETGQHMEDANQEIQWAPFPTCLETSRPLEFRYGVEGEINCTIAAISDPFFHLLEFYIHSDAPLSCRIPSRPIPPVEIVGQKPQPQEYIPLVFALAGKLQLSHVHVATHMNVLLHSTAKKRIRPRDTGILDSGIAYSTSPLGRDGKDTTRKIVIGDELPLSFSVRWFPTPELPRTDGTVDWQGMGGSINTGTLVYILLSFVAGVVLAAVYFYGRVLPGRLRGRALGGATPLGHGVAGGVGNGWGYAKRLD